MKTLESLLDADFDIKTFDYDPIDAGLTPTGDKDWQNVVEGINNQILAARTIPALNKFIESAKETVDACTYKGKLTASSADTRKVLQLANDVAKMKTLVVDLPEYRINMAIKLNELNDMLCKNRKFCEFCKKWNCWCAIRIATDANDGRTLFRFISNDGIDTTECIADFESLRLKTPKDFETTTTTNQEGCVIITFRVAK